MNNFNFSRPSPDGDKFFVTFGYYVQNERSDGSVSLDKIDDPYDGLLGSSFSLEAQINAGVPLKKVGALSSGLISEIDKSNQNASDFVNSVMSNISNS